MLSMWRLLSLLHCVANVWLSHKICPVAAMQQPHSLLDDTVALYCQVFTQQQQRVASGRWERSPSTSVSWWPPSICDRYVQFDMQLYDSQAAAAAAATALSNIAWFYQQSPLLTLPGAIANCTAFVVTVRGDRFRIKTKNDTSQSSGFKFKFWRPCWFR